MAFDGCSAEIAEKLKKAGLEPTSIAVPAHPGKIIFWGFLPGLDDMPTQFWNEVSKVLFPGEATDKARPSTNLNIFEVAQQNQMYTTTHLISYTYLGPPILQVVFDDNKSNIILQKLMTSRELCTAWPIFFASAVCSSDPIFQLSLAHPFTVGKRNR